MAATRWLVSAGRSVPARIGRTWAEWERRARRSPPADRSVLGDLVARRPWNLAVKASRTLARWRGGRRDGVTVIVVSWNTREVLADVITAVRALSPGGVEVMVVDNGSSDGTRAMLRRHPDVRLVALPSNAGHGVALDLAMCWVRTTVAVTLDSDAIPFSPGWLDPAVEPVRTGAAIVAGLRATRGYVHPVYLAADVEQVLARGLSFQVHRDHDGGGDVWGVDAWDTGELLSAALPPERIAFVEPTENRAPTLPGMSVGDVVYHHGGLSRLADGALDRAALATWRQACRDLGLEPVLEGHAIGSRR